MDKSQSVLQKAQIAINDMLDQCARIQPDQRVLILAHTDGLYGSDNLVDKTAISLIQSAIRNRGANPSILWVDEILDAHDWRLPSKVKAAIAECDVLINHSFDITGEELIELRELTIEHGIILVRNFATTVPLLTTDWAQTPYELVSEIRYHASVPFKKGAIWELEHENGTNLKGYITSSTNPIFPNYTTRRYEIGGYRPWPEWVIPPIEILETSGTFIFDRMLSWWSRYIGISPYFKNPIKLIIDNCRITHIEGGHEAEALKDFLVSMASRLGDGVYNFNSLHCGVHPQAVVGPHQCPIVNYRRLIEHSHSSNIHIHIGAPPPTPTYPYWMHCTGDLQGATWKVDDMFILNQGKLTALSNPHVLAVAKKYPGRPGLETLPLSQ